MKIEENSAVKKYVINLRDEISNQVRPMKPKTINEALQEALEAELWLKEKNTNRFYKVTQCTPNLFYQPQQQFRPTSQLRALANTTPHVPNQNVPLSERVKIKCHKCGNLGHFAYQ